MPVIKGISGKYRFFFYSKENHEPPHVHIEKDNAIAKVWLKDISVARNKGFKSKEMSEILNLVIEHKSKIEKAWHEHFNA